MLLQYVEDPDVHEIMFVSSLISNKKAIGSTVEYCHPTYNTVFKRILLHFGSERNCNEYEDQLIRSEFSLYIH